MRHAALGIFPPLNRNGVVKPLPHSAVTQFIIARLGRNKIINLNNTAPSLLGQQNQLMSLVVYYKAAVRIAA